MQEEYAEALEDDGTGHTFEDDEQMPEKHDNVESIDPSFLLGGAGSDTNIDEMGDIEEIIGQMKNELDDYDHEKDRESNASKFASIFENANDLSNQETAVGAPEIKARDDSSRASSTNQPMVQESSNHSEGALPSGFDSFEVEKIKDLQNALPGMPLSRVKKILKAFDTTLSYPSLITLVPILRETMPDYISSGWLKRINSKNADFVLRKASENGLVDTPILNTMIQVKTSGGSLDEALAFYNEQFKEYQKVSLEA